MASFMSPEMQKTFENTWAYEMNQQLKEMFKAKASKECLNVVKSFSLAKPTPRALYLMFRLRMKGYLDSKGSRKVMCPHLSEAPVLTVWSTCKKKKDFSFQTLKGKAKEFMSWGHWKRSAQSNLEDRGKRRKGQKGWSLSRYGYVYLIKHKLDTFEVFKRYQNEVENQLVRKIKLTPPRTPQLNGVAERRNRALLDMIRSMMCQETLPISFWGYALETAAHILILYLLKRREAQDKLEARSEKCLFVGYPEVSFKYLFYKPKDNVVFVARRGVFLEREMISKEDSGSKIDLKEIQESANEEPIINTNTQQEVVTPVETDDISLPVRRTKDKISDSTLTELNKPANYKEVMASLEVAKWKKAMKSEIQSMLVAKGYTQTHRIDYEETFSPVAKIKSIRIMLAIAAFHDYEIWQMDVNIAFLNGKLIEDVFMAQPEGFENEKYPKRVCKLQKVIYGLKQASRS
ncbi:retrotransposon protein, putative, ty1-copia subclass [Tanacetum coccineum]